MYEALASYCINRYVIHLLPFCPPDSADAPNCESAPKRTSHTQEDRNIWGAVWSGNPDTLAMACILRYMTHGPGKGYLQPTYASDRDSGLARMSVGYEHAASVVMWKRVM